MSADNSGPSGQDSGSSVDQANGGAAGANRWAKAVVDGMPVESAADDPAGATPGGDGPAESPPVGDKDHLAGQDRPSVDQAEADLAEPEQTRTEQTTADPAQEQDPGREAAEATGDVDVADEENSDGDISVEDLVIDLERVTTERDQYLDASRRLQAEFENYKKQVLKREIEARERANDSLVGELLPVLDAFDGAVANGAEDVSPMRATFLDALGKHGLERIDPTDDPFDPTLHEAVMHEEASDTDGPVVAEVMRAGYVWKGRVLRPAMVRTRG